MERVVDVTTVIEELEDICDKIESGDYDLQDIYDECQRKIFYLRMKLIRR